MYTEKGEMEEQDKRVEILANKLMESTTIKINIETTKSGGDEVKGIDEKGLKAYLLPQMMTIKLIGTKSRKAWTTTWRWICFM
jgi:hypothetical protein